MRANQKPRTLPDDDAHGNPASGISDGDSAAGAIPQQLLAILDNAR